MAVDSSRQAIFELVAQSINDGPLNRADETRLRVLLSAYNSAAPRLPWDELYHAALFTLGVWITFEPDTIDVEG